MAIIIVIGLVSISSTGKGTNKSFASATNVLKTPLRKAGGTWNPPPEVVTEKEILLNNGSRQTKKVYK